MTKLTDKHVRFVDNGVFHAFARKLAPAFGKADYYSPWQSAFTSYRRTRLGEGFPELERVNYPLLDADKVDLWVFLDVFHSDLQIFLADHGARVFGARMGEELELHRWELKQWLKRHNLPVTGDLIVGTNALEAFLEDKKDVFIKGDDGLAREDMETWKWKGKHISTPKLKEIIYDLGPFAEDFRFVVEEEMKGCHEVGFDDMTVDGQFSNLAMQGVEAKGLGLFGVVRPYKELEKPIRTINEALSPALRKYTYRGFLATEILYGQERRPYLMDPCCRLGSPSNEVLQEIITNWPDRIWEGAEGRMVDAEASHKYGMVLMVYSEQSGKNWQPLHYPPEMDRWVKLRTPFARGKRRYSIPQPTPANIAGVVGLGNTPEECFEAVKEHAAQVNGQLIEIGTDAVKAVLENIEIGRKYGVEFCEDPMPKD